MMILIALTENQSLADLQSFGKCFLPYVFSKDGVRKRRGMRREKSFCFLEGKCNPLPR
jgi:hypothetical protein